MEISQTLYVTTRAAWRRWLAKNHATAADIWLIYPRKHSGKRRLSYNDCVEEALCFGWIDSTMKRLDDDHSAQRFSPRRSAKSVLSETNKERVRRMISAGLMTPAGLEKIQARMEEKFAISPEVIAALRRDPVAWKNYQALPELYRRIRIGWIQGAWDQGRMKEYEKRLRYFIRMTALNKRFGQLR